MKQPKIEDGIPIPTARKRSGVVEILRKLKVGQSFLVDPAARNAVHAAANKVFGQAGHVATRSEGDFVRVWRIK